MSEYFLHHWLKNIAYNIYSFSCAALKLHPSYTCWNLNKKMKYYITREAVSIIWKTSLGLFHHFIDIIHPDIWTVCSNKVLQCLFYCFNQSLKAEALAGWSRICVCLFKSSTLKVLLAVSRLCMFVCIFVIQTEEIFNGDVTALFRHHSTFTERDTRWYLSPGERVSSSDIKIK